MLTDDKIRVIRDLYFIIKRILDSHCHYLTSSELVIALLYNWKTCKNYLSMTLYLNSIWFIKWQPMCQMQSKCTNWKFNWFDFNTTNWVDRSINFSKHTRTKIYSHMIAFLTRADFTLIDIQIIFKWTKRVKCVL